MKGKDFVKREVQKNVPFILQGQPQYNAAQETPFFLGQINADRTQITDTSSGRVYNLFFTGNPREFEYAAAISPYEAVVNAQHIKQFNIDGDTKEWILYSNLGPTNTYALPIPEILTSGTLPDGTTPFPPTPLSISASASFSDAASNYFVNVSLAIYDFKTDTNYYFPLTEPIFTFTEGMYPTQFITPGYYLTPNGNNPIDTSYQYPVAICGEPSYFACLDDTGSSLTIFRVESAPTVSSMIAGPQQITDQVPPSPFTSYPQNLKPSQAYYAISDIVYTVYWATYRGIGLKKDLLTGSKTITFSKLADADQGSFGFHYQFGLGSATQPSSSSTTTSGPLIPGPGTVTQTVDNTVTVSESIFNNVMTAIPTISKNSAGNLVINIVGAYSSTCMSNIIDTSAVTTTIIRPSGTTVTSQTTVTPGFQTPGKVTGMYSIQGINLDNVLVSYNQLYDGSQDPLNQTIVGNFTRQIAPIDNTEYLTTAFFPIGSTLSPLINSTSTSYVKGTVLGGVSIGPIETLIYNVGGVLYFMVSAETVDSNNVPLENSYVTIYLLSLPGENGNNTNQALDSANFYYSGSGVAYVSNTSFINDGITSIYDELNHQFPDDPFFNYIVALNDPNNVSSEPGIYLPQMFYEFGNLRLRSGQTWELLDFVTQGVKFTGNLAQYDTSNAFINNGQFKTLRKLKLGVDPKTNKILILSTKNVKIPTGSLNWKGPKDNLVAMQNFVIK